MKRRDFLKTCGVCVVSAPFLIPSSEQFPRKYHKITKDWSLSTSSVTLWNDFNIYSKVGLSKDVDLCFGEMDNENEYVLRSDFLHIYVNKDKCYRISNYKGEWVENTNHHLFEVDFDIVEYLGPTPTERIIIISDYDYCIYALGRDHYKQKKEFYSPFGLRKSWTLDRHEVFRPLTEEMHSKIRYFDFNRKTYKEYLQIYNTKLKQLNLI